MPEATNATGSPCGLGKMSSVSSSLLNYYFPEGIVKSLLIIAHDED